jgi:hypothetical protein
MVFYSVYCMSVRAEDRIAEAAAVHVGVWREFPNNVNGGNVGSGPRVKSSGIQYRGALPLSCW